MLQNVWREWGSEFDLPLSPTNGIHPILFWFPIWSQKHTQFGVRHTWKQEDRKKEQTKKASFVTKPPTKKTKKTKLLTDKRNQNKTKQTWIQATKQEQKGSSFCRTPGKGETRTLFRTLFFIFEKKLLE